MQVQKEDKIGEIVARNFHTAHIFESFGLDFCCGGKKSINDACDEKRLNPENVILELTKIIEEPSNDARYINWDPDFLIDYIINNHHQYVVSSVPIIEHHLSKVVSAHGEKHPELIQIENIFDDLKADLLNHMQKEEKMLFPYIKKLNQSVKQPSEVEMPPFGSINNPLKVLESEHESAGRMMAEINKLSSAYTMPEGGCGTYMVLYRELNEFENDLHKHVHLENNIIFPKSQELERKVKMRSA